MTVPFLIILYFGEIMELPVRKATRLNKYNYATYNIYFVTICTYQRTHLFGDVGNLNQFGLIAESELINIPKHFNSVKIEKYVIMPNHIHAIIVLNRNNSDFTKNKTPTLSTVIGLYKSGVSKQIHEKLPYTAVWQKSFFDAIIWDDKSYDNTWNYIDSNISNWLIDEHYT